MNFFQSLIALQVAGDWKINIVKETADRLIVSVLFFNDTIGDEARKKVPPILLKGTAEELDAGFFEAIAQTVKDTAQLFANMEQFLKEAAQAKISSQMEKDNILKMGKEKTEMQKKYEEAMKKADELEGLGKFKEAWMKVPQANLYPEHKDIIHKRKAELSDKFPIDLFNDPNTEEPC
ncbi:PRTRC system protein E [Flavobacterium hydatis]|uniref:Prtrc system protein e n=1 Tax=Flavobacterium hydatis TaxID=991 RepID=A0A086A3B4_FLAHY|nr:PRTRC system protein E [Flavobacterium hydatis]KFF11178.1 prtrc system protein e [Flavobacterium hydatis]OXA97837.1 prtrc system protein e [Flavobacterium hydatis]